MRFCSVVFVSLSLIILQSCSPTDKKAATALTRHINNINDTVFYYGKIWGENVGQAVVTKDFTIISATRQKQLNYLDTAMLTVAGMHDVNGSEDLRNAELNFLKFEKQMFINVASVEHFNQNTSDEEILKALDDLKLVSRQETEMLGNVQTLQQTYANKNGLTMDTTKAGN